MTDVVVQAEQDGYVQTMMHRRRALPEPLGVLGVQVNVAERCHEMKTIFRAGFQQVFERLHRFSVLLCRKFFTVKFRRQFSAHQLCGRCLPS